MFEVRYAYSPAFARRVALRWLWLTGAGYQIGFAIVGVVSVVASVRGHAPWLAGLGVGATAAWYWSCFNSLRWAGIRAGLSGDPTIVIRLDEDRLSVRSDAGEWIGRWSWGWRLHRFSDCWLIVRPRRYTVLALPVDTISPDVRSFIEARVAPRA